jgi:uncharacterized protein YbjQ (UPF0145 family)
MLLSTLPDLPGRPFDVRGLAFAQATVTRDKDIQGMIQSIVEQAARFGADSIVDIKTIVGSGASWQRVIMTGTAVKLVPPSAIT